MSKIQQKHLKQIALRSVALTSGLTCLNELYFVFLFLKTNEKKLALELKRLFRKKFGEVR